MSRLSAPDAIREDRCDYTFHTKAAAAAVECHPNKFGDWLYRTRRKLTALYAADPAATTEEFARIMREGAEGLTRRREDAK